MEPPRVDGDLDRRVHGGPALRLQPRDQHGPPRQRHPQEPLARRTGAGGPSAVRVMANGSEIIRTTSATPDSLTRRALTGLLAGSATGP